MAVVAEIVVESRRYSGWIDPRYPIGYWQAALTVVGDATGGNLGISLVFQSALAVSLNSQLYSVERLSIVAEDSINRIVKLSGVNMGGPANLGFTHEYAVSLEVITGPGGTAVRGQDMAFLPLFLGSQRIPGITASLSLLTSNTNDTVFRLEAEGYRWSPRSVLIDGGPQRPPTGLYRA